MKAALIAGVLVAAALVLYLLKRTEPNPPVAADDPPPVLVKPAEPLARPPLAKIEHAQLEARADRQQLAEQIARRPPRPTTLPANADPLHDAIPLLADCYDKASSQLPEKETRIAAKLTLISDPDVGTIVDAHQISDEQGRPLLASFDDCLHEAMQLLALPPIGNGGTIDVTYPFVFHK